MELKSVKMYRLARKFQPRGGTGNFVLTKGNETKRGRVVRKPKQNQSNMKGVPKIPTDEKS